MHAYEKKLYTDVNNPQYKFYKLYVDGVCRFDEFLNALQRNKSDKKLYNAIVAYMDQLTDQTRFPAKIFNHIVDEDRHDLYEFKKDRLRVYVVRQRPDIYIVIGGFKATQKNDIEKLKSMIKDFPKEDAI